MESPGRAGLILAALLFAAPPAPAQTQDQRRELGRIQKELGQTKAALEEYRRQEAALSRNLHKLASQDSQTRGRINAIEGNIRRAEGRRSALKSRLGALKFASGFWTSVIYGEFRDYASGLAEREEAWGGRTLWAEALRRGALLEDARIAASLRGYRRKTEAAAAAARSRADGLQDKSRQAQSEALALHEQFTRTQAAVSEAHGKVAAAEKRARELEETKVALTKLLAQLASRQPPAPSGAALPEMARNSLPWPVDGVLRRPFGRERDPELHTWAIHQGVTFETQPAAVVAAVGAGRVIYSGEFRSYGKVVILDHGNGFYSIYGELGNILKGKGAAVGAGESLGTAGAANGKGALYLELRRGTQALDPMLWLKNKS